MLDFVPDSALALSEVPIRRVCAPLSSKAVSRPHVYQRREYKVPKSVKHNNSCYCIAW